MSSMGMMPKSAAKFHRQRLKDNVWLHVAFELAQLGTCARRKVGCVFLDEAGKVLATGYNGVAPGDSHCTDSPCPGAGYPSGQGLEFCEAIHAEQNAVAQCRFPERVHTVYCTDSPCIHCVKMIASTGAKRIVFAREYPHSASKAYWTMRGGFWEHVQVDNPHLPPPKATTVEPRPPTSFWERLAATWAGWFHG